MNEITHYDVSVDRLYELFPGIHTGKKIVEDNREQFWRLYMKEFTNPVVGFHDKQECLTKDYKDTAFREASKSILANYKDIPFIILSGSTTAIMPVVNTYNGHIGLMLFDTRKQVK